MSRPQVRIENSSGIGHHTRVLIDGVNVSGCVRSLVLCAEPDHVLTATLEVFVAEVEVDGALDLKLPLDGTHELLVKHGWIPPSDPTAPDDAERA